VKDRAEAGDDERGAALDDPSTTPAAAPAGTLVAGEMPVGGVAGGAVANAVPGPVSASAGDGAANEVGPTGEREVEPFGDPVADVPVRRSRRTLFVVAPIFSTGVTPSTTLVTVESVVRSMAVVMGSVVRSTVAVTGSAVRSTAVVTGPAVRSTVVVTGSAVRPTVVVTGWAVRSTVAVTGSAVCSTALVTGSAVRPTVVVTGWAVRSTVAWPVLGTATELT
jgi:hypothetical protein